MENLKLKQSRKVDKEYATRAAELIMAYAKLNENGRAKADEYLHDILTQIKDYTCELPINTKTENNVIYVDFKKAGVC